MNWLNACLLGFSLAALVGCAPTRVNDQKADAEKAELIARVKWPRSSAQFPLLQPRHPESLRDQGGIVGLHLYVDETGRPRKVMIGKSSGKAELDESATASVGTWRLLPGTVDGEPRAMWSCFIITFHPVDRGTQYEPTKQDAQDLMLFDQKCDSDRIKLSDLPARP